MNGGVYAAAALVASLLTAASALAQSLPPVRLGVVGGVNLATLGGKDVDDADTRTGFLGGASLLVPLRGRLSLDLQGLYSQKGANDSDSVERIALTFNYLELPLMLRYDLTSEGIRPFLTAGVSVAYRASCKAQVEAEGINAEFDCDDLTDGEDFRLDVKRWDPGAAFGGGVDIPLAQDRRLTVGARYVLGMTDIVDMAAVRNRTVQLYAGFSVPLR